MEWKNIIKGGQSNLEATRLKSPYEILSVNPDVSKEELREAYIKKVKAYHPDCSDPFLKQYNQEMLKIVNLAYEHLKEVSECQPIDT